MGTHLRKRVALRAEKPEDMEFVQQVYASTRAEEIAMTGWDEMQVKIFLDMQFKAQYTHYRNVFPAASFDIILLDGAPGFSPRYPNASIFLTSASGTRCKRLLKRDR